MVSIPVSTINWSPCYRLIATRFPAINFFESVASDPSDWEILLEVERLTDPSFDVGDLSTLATLDRLSGPGAGRILPSFTFRDQIGTRFSTPEFGAHYASEDLKTAIAETIHHRSLFMRATCEPAQDLDQLLILADLQGVLHDIRGMIDVLGDVYSLTSYSQSQALADSLRKEASLGLVFDSVRNKNGQCAAIWRARVLSNAREDRHITYRWDGTKITGYFDKSDFVSL
ncbi:MAG: family phosphorylase [Cyanobacteriota bacterium erpe_2018_sw_39hr_WHONDRS-SW48-000098_B_bin.30]|nr:family phosphorylase [Cyanobacteriota bacterium erpe_2018_sw_39hr_WHONDRS-SW48-000098_B_bin.30]